MRVGDEHVQWRPWGALHPDGSVRYARCHTLTAIAGNASADLAVSRGAAANAPTVLTPHPNASAVFPGNMLMLLTCQGVQVNLLAGQPELVEQGRLANRLRYRGRIAGTPCWYELHVEIGHAVPTWRWWLHYGNSDSTRSDPAYALTSDVELLIVGADSVVRHVSVGKAEVLAQATRSATYRLLRGSYAGQPNRSNFSDGYSQLLHGSLMFTAPAALNAADALTVSAESMDQVWALATPETWRASGQFGPFGVIPTRPSWLASDAAARAVALEKAISDYGGAQWTGDPWSPQRYGRNRNGGVSGDQNDFGIIHYYWIVDSGEPLALKPAQWSAYQEACGGYHHREPDVSQVTSENHPNLVIWQGRIHMGGSDRLGKARELQGSEMPHGGYGYPGSGWINQPTDEHWSINHVFFYALLTGDVGAELMLRDLAECWMLMHTVNGPSATLNGVGAARRVGRMNYSGVQLWMALGDPRLESRGIFKIDTTYWLNRPNNHMSFYKPLATAGPAGTQIREVRQVIWEDYQGLMGLTAAAMHWESQRAQTITAAVYANSVQHGHRDFRIGSQYRWIQGNAANVGLVPGEIVTSSGGGTARLMGHMHDGFTDILLYDVVGTFAQGNTIHFQQSNITRTITNAQFAGMAVATALAWNNGNQLTEAQLLEAVPWPYQDKASPLRYVLWSGNLASWVIGPIAWAAANLTASDPVTAARAAELLAILVVRTRPANGWYDDSVARWVAMAEV